MREKLRKWESFSALWEFRERSSLAAAVLLLRYDAASLASRSKVNDDKLALVASTY